MENNFTTEQIRDFWDKVAPIYEPANERVGYVHYQRFEKGLRHADLQPGQKVLNIWSRMGGFIPYARKTPELELFNREVSPEFMARAKQKFPNENFALTNLEDFSEFPNNNFDRVISLETLEHAPKPLVFLLGLARILKPGGILVLSLPPKGFEIPTIIWDKFFHNHGEGPHNFLWPHQVKKLLSLAGLDLFKHDPTIILPLKNDRYERLSEKILTAIFKKTPIINFGVRHFYVCKKPKTSI